MNKAFIQKTILRIRRDKEDGFTLVELIVVVVIIGILSSIAIPSFQNASDKAKQKEPAVLIASYLKAAQAFYTEYGTIAKSSKDLGQYLSVTGCRRNFPAYCKNNPARDYTNLNSNSWTTPDGYFDIYMEIRSNKLNFRAMPVPVYQNSGYGVSGCFNPQNGATKVVEHPRKLVRAIPFIDC